MESIIEEGDVVVFNETFRDDFGDVAQKGSTGVVEEVLEHVIYVSNDVTQFAIFDETIFTVL